MAKRDRFRDEILEIIQGKTHYGTVPIEKKKINQNVIWIGTNGYTASVGQWIRQVAEQIDKGFAPKQGFRWYTVFKVFADMSTQNMWYYGITLENESDSVTYICGGCTDFSGEGGRGHKLAEYFLNSLLAENFIVEQNADHLISMLTCDDD